ncbi:hypothetical protein CONLIGDRAFT_570992 [Coniochaeta ligniaria NRRL 30616]|uniref:Pentacotripeptide-repeat region of PRORP domain-containing protein n=1 Tax=Coniochaeta ligniaria NRRL 30616 TaxID=1408157 RepID=A0A1J7JWD0_9PEZI|nr:hypothetical protein CONLIGDRAFT_570992 [Coniochaeta ligniaria NRRL 30616]
MPGARITIDGLWRCLCPSIDELALSRALRRPAPSLSPLPGRTSRRRPTICTAQWRARPIHTTSRRCNASTAEAQAPSDHVASIISREDGQGEDKPATAQDILQAPNPPRDLLNRAPTPAIYEALRVMLTQPKRRPQLRALVKYLVDHRSQTPNAFLYEALIASNWEPSGSAEEVLEILNEMRILGVGTTSSLYHAALRALAIHPDYLLRNRIISEMRERWLDLTPDGRCSIALGLLRDGQHELALDKLEEMLDSNLPVPSWVHDIFIVVLTQHTHLDEALTLLQRRTHSSSYRTPLSPTIWSLFLDECSRNNHYPGTRLAWDALVPTKLLTPSDGVCLAVLNTASRHSDPHLATSAVASLSSRGAKLGPHHYEALADCYAHRDDVPSALHTLCIMSRAGCAATQASASSLRSAFRRNPGLAHVGRDSLLRLGETFAVPIAAFNVVLEGLCGQGSDGEAFDLYRLVRHLCGCGPDYWTFKPLMEMGWDVGVARFLMEEMRAFGVRPTREFYERVVYLAAVEGELDTCFQVLGELEGSGGEERVKLEGWIGRETALAVVRRCVAERDERLWDLLWVARRVGLDLGPAGRALAESAEAARGEWVKEKEREEGRKEGDGKEGDRDGQEVEREVPPWLGDAFFSEKKAVEKKAAAGDVGSGKRGSVPRPVRLDDTKSDIEAVLAMYAR